MSDLQGVLVSCADCSGFGCARCNWMGAQRQEWEIDGMVSELVDRSRDVFAGLADLDLAERVETLNAIRVELAKFSPRSPQSRSRRSSPATRTASPMKWITP